MHAAVRRICERRRSQESLEPKERVRIALDHREPDRVPIDFWAVEELTGRLLRALGMTNEEEMLEAFGVDFRVIRGPSLSGLKLERYADGSFRDLWGVVRRPVSFGRGTARGRYMEVAFSPLGHMKTVEEVENYEHWPSPDWWDYSNVKQECREHEDYCVVFAGDRLDRTAQLKTAMYMRGMKEILTDLRRNPEIAKCIFQHVAEYFLEYNRRVFEAADGLIDIFMMGDDFGTQNGPMMPDDLWAEFLEEGFREFIRLAHEYGILVMHHTCGSVRTLIPAFIRDGLDILQSLQPRAKGMDLGSLKKDFGQQISFHGSIDVQHTMPRGTEADVRREVADRMAAGKPGGGFVICTAHNLQVDVPTKNVLALVESYHELGGYGEGSAQG